MSFWPSALRVTIIASLVVASATPALASDTATQPARPATAAAKLTPPLTKTAPAKTTKAATAGLPAACTDYGYEVSCSYSAGTSSDLPLSSGAYNVSYFAAAGGGGGGGGQSGNGGGGGGGGSDLSGSLGSVGGTTLHIGVGTQGHAGGTTGTNPLGTYGNFNGGTGGDGTSQAGGGGAGGAATVIGSNSNLLVVAGGGGGGGGTYHSFLLGTDTGGGGGTGGSGGGSSNPNGGNGSNGPGGTGGGGGGGAGGWHGGNGGGSSVVSGGHGGQGGGDLAQNGATKARDAISNSGDGSVTIIFNRTTPTLSVTPPAGSSYAWQTATLGYSVSSSAGTPTGTVAVTDNTTGSQVCNYNLSGGNGSCDLSGGQLTAGNHSLTFAYSGDSGYASQSTSTTIAVLPDPVSVFLSPVVQPDHTYAYEATVLPDDRSNGIVDGTLSLSASPASGALTASCPAVTSPAASNGRRGVALTLNCTPAMLPGNYTIKATFTGHATSADGWTTQLVTIDSYTPTVDLKFAPSVLPAYGASTTATVTVSQPAYAQSDVSGTVSVSSASSPGCTATYVGKTGLNSTYSCSLTPHAGTQTYTATYAGNTYYQSASSAGADVTTTRATPTLTLAPGSTTIKVGDPLPLTASVQDTTGTDVATGTVSIYDGPVAPDLSNLVGTIDLSQHSGGDTITITPSAGTHVYTAQFIDASGNYDTVTVTALAVSVQPLHATIAVKAVGDSSAATSAGIPTTVTTTIAMDPLDTRTKPITLSPVPVGSCTRSESIAANSDRVITYTCHYVEQPGTTPTYTATYSDDLVATLTGTEKTYAIPASPTAVTASSTDVDFGAAPVFSATVTTTVDATAVTGKVEFREGVNLLCTGTIAVSGGASKAGCSPSSTTHAGAHSIVAKYVPDVVTNPVTLTSTSAAAAFTVRKDPVSIDLSTSQSATKLTVAVSTSVDGNDPSAPIPAGSIAFGDGISSCATIPLSGGVANCVIDLPAAGKKVTLSATYVPSSDFKKGTTPAASVEYQRPSSGPCSVAFGNIWALAQAASGSFTEDAGALGTVTLKVPQGIGSCDAAATLGLTADVSLFGGTLTASNLIASVTQQQGLCLTGGSLSLPAIWKTGAVTITQAICFPLSPNGAISKPVGGALALGNTGSATLPLLAIPGVTGAATLTARLGTACPGNTVGSTGCATPAPAITITGSVPAASASVPGVTVVATVGTNGGITASVTSTAISIFGASIALSGSVSRATKSDPLTVSVAATLAQAASPVPGLTLLEGATITLTGGTGSSPTLAVSGTVRIADGTPAQVEIAISGSFTSAADYSLDLATSSPAPSWTPVAGLTLSPVLAGHLTRSGGTTTFSLSASGSNGTPLATWNAPGGVTVTVDAISLGGDPTKTDLGCPYSSGLIAAVSGGLTVGGLAVHASGCVSLADGGWHVAAAAKTASVSGLALTDLVLDATHPGGGSTTVFGSATAALSVGSFAGSTTVTMSVDGGVFVIGGQLDATSLGLPSVSTYLAYASAAKKGWQTGLQSVGQGGVVDLPAGVSLFGSLKLPAAVAAVLKKANFALPSDATVTFSATVGKGATGITFTAALATPSGFPLLTLPGGATIDSAVITYAAKTFGLTADGTIKGQDGSSAPVHLAVTISASGDFSGSASVTGLSLFGKTLNLSGAVTRTNGVFSATVTAAINGDVTVGDATLHDITVTIGTSGLVATGSLDVASTTVAFSAAFASTTSYSLDVSVTVRNWSPAAGVTVNALISGSLTRTAKGYSYDFSAVPLAGSSALLTITPTAGVTLAMQSFELSNGTAPAGCTLGAAGDSWLAVAGSVSFSLGQSSGTAVGTGCFDLTKPAFTLTVGIPSADFGGAGGKVTLGGLTLTISKSGADFSVDAKARLNVQMPSGGTFSLIALITFGDKGFAIGGVADLSSFLGGSAARAYLFYATTSISVKTGDATLGTLKLKPGITVGLDFTVSASVSQALNHLGLDIGAGSSLAATANINLTDATIILSIGLNFAQTNIFSTSNGTYLRANSMALQMTLSPTQPSFGFVVDATLHVPSTTPGGQPSDIGMTGGISIGTQLTAFFTISNWNDALGIRGLSLQEFTLQGGITLTGLPLPSLAFTATVNGLPQSLADVIGYQQGAPMSISVAIGETNLLLDIKIGVKDSHQVALAPFSLFGKASLLTVNYAELYISPTGATIGQTVYSPGFSLGFQGNIAGVDVDVFAKVDPVNASFYFRGSVGVINVGSISIGPTVLTIDASPSSFNLTFSGRLSIGPSTTNIGPALRFSGYLKADVTLAIGTDGIAAHMNFDASVTGSNYLPQGWCKWHGIWVLCDWAWVDDSPLTIHLDNIGFAVNGSGLTVDIPNTASSITFPFPGHSSTAARTTALAGSAPTAQTVDLAALGAPANQLTRATSPPVAAASNWHATGSMGSARIVAGGLALHDGSVLVAGGSTSAGQALRSAEIYDAKTGGWRATGALHTARINPTLVELGDGRVLAVGGDTGTGETGSAELYSPKTGRWTPAGAMAVARQGASAAVLADGRVLIAGGHAGGRPMTAVDLFDPSTGKWHAGAPLAVARAAAASAPLANGDVLVAGGMGASGPLRSVEIYSAASDTWSAGRPMAHPRFYASAARLADGRVLVAGDAARAEVYDPTTGRWSSAGSQAAPALLASMVTLPNGHVLVAGGLSVSGSLTQVDEYDPATNHWTARAKLPGAVGGAVAAPVAGGVLIAGGLNHSAAGSGAYVYTLAYSSVPSAKYRAQVTAPTTHASSSGWSGMATLWLIVGIVLALLLLAIGLFIAANRRRPATPTG